MANIFKSFENFAPSYTGSDDSIVSAIAVYESADACQAAAEQLSAILDDYRTVREAMVASRKGERSAAFEALVGPSLKQYASMEEAKDTRKFWDKVKEFFIRLWHSVQDFFAKFSVFASAMKSKLDKLNIREIAKGVDKDMNVEDIKVKILPEASYKAAVQALLDASNARPDDQAKMSETAKTLTNAKKAFAEAIKGAAETTMDINGAEATRLALSKGLGQIISGRQKIVADFKAAVDSVKGGLEDGDPNKKLRINALKDLRHNQLMAVLTISKQLIKDSKALIKAVKGMKKKKAANA